MDTKSLEQASIWEDAVSLVHRVTRQAGVELREYGLTCPQYMVLRRLASGENATQQALADALGVTKGNASQMLLVLEDAGWIVKKPVGASNFICLTEAGQHVIDEATQAYGEFLAKQFRSLDQQDWQFLRAILEKLA